MKSATELFEQLPADGFGLIDCKTLSGRLNSGESPVILDIRKEVDWQQDRIPGSIHSEWEKVGALVDSGMLPSGKDIVVVCYVGQSSGHTTGMLRALGFRSYSLLDGFMEWKESGFPMEHDSPDAADP